MIRLHTSTMPELHFIVNPAAGGGSCLRRFRVVEESLLERGVACSAVYSEYAGHATELTHQALTAGRERIVAVGGDGTVREVAQELLHTGVPLGVLPFGTGNDLIRALRIPADPVLAAELLLAGDPRTVDAACVNDQLFINVAGFGFDVEVLEKTRYYKNRVRGSFAYLLGLLHALIDLRSHRVCVYTEKGLLEEDVLMVVAGNGNCIGGGMRVTPLADPTDGLLDFCVVSRVGRLGVLRFLARFIKGDHLDMSFVRYFQADTLVVECEEELLVQLDGEIIGHTPATFRVLPAALNMITGEIGTAADSRELQAEITG